MQRQGRRDTAAELALRRELHRRGRRFYVDRAPLPGLRRRADLVFPRLRVAVYVDGCFWHSCPLHATRPRNNAEWWAAKLAANVARDRDTDARLTAAGWTVVRIWEHEDPIAAADHVHAALDAAAARSRQPRAAARSSASTSRRRPAIEPSSVTSAARTSPS
jgi:DNA mismatch endonuclease (patch repair protein)